jgi:hypothetical protein
VAQIQDALGNRYTNTANFTVLPYVVLDSSTAIALGQVDTSKPGFKVKSYQSLRYQPNQLRWTEEQVIGLRGPNDADQTGAVGGFFSWDNIPDFSGGGVAISSPIGNSFYHFPVSATAFPDPAVADNRAVELFGYMYFPPTATTQCRRQR